MKLEYRTFEEAQKKFKWSDRWEVFDRKPENLNIAYECVDRHPKEKIAIRLKNEDRSREVYTYEELSRVTSQFAQMLERRGIRSGDRVAIMLNPSLEYYVSFYGILKRGAVVVPCYALLGPDAIEYRLKESNAKMLITYKDKMGAVNSGLVSHLIATDGLLGLIQKEEDHYEPKTS